MVTPVAKPPIAFRNLAGSRLMTLPLATAYITTLPANACQRDSSLLYHLLVDSYQRICGTVCRDCRYHQDEPAGNLLRTRHVGGPAPGSFHHSRSGLASDPLPR